MEKAQVKRERRMRYAGNEILYVTVSEPTGDTPCATHVRELLCRWETAWISALEPRARQALESAVAAGRGFSFRRFRLELGTRVTSRGKWQSVVPYALWQGTEDPVLYELPTMLWSADGTFQRVAPRDALKWRNMTGKKERRAKKTHKKLI